MATSQKIQLQNIEENQSTVYFDAMDDLFIEPLREFFYNYGCVEVKEDIKKRQLDYHIIAGDREFVKTILEKPKLSAKKTLVLVWEYYEHAINFENYKKSKFVIVDTKPLSDSDVKMIVEFFFIGSGQWKNISTKPIEKIVVQEQKNIYEENPKSREAKAEIIQQDETRIQKTIANIFSTSHEKPIRTKHSFSFLTYVFFIAFFLILPLFGYISALGISTFSLYQTTPCIQKGNDTCVSNWSNISFVWNERAKVLLQIISIPFKVTNALNPIRSQERLLDLFAKITEIEKDTNQLAKQASRFTISFFPNTSPVDKDQPTVVTVEQMKTQLFALQNNLDLSSLTLNELTQSQTFPFSNVFLKKQMVRIKTVIDKYRLYANSINQLLLLYPYISGYKRNISFLVVFQNNAELRPTGGFIGSLMKVNIEDGKIIDTTVLDVYDVDGQLKGHIDPPQPIRDLLSQEHWYLRDSNWNPDFSLSAEKIAWFYNKETGETVDGVIGINASFVTKLLAITGPIQLLDGGDTITADNFFAKSLYYTQNNFFPGSTQKKDFLGSLMNGMYHLLFSGKYISAPQLFEAIQQSLVTRNIQLYFTDPEAQQLADQFQWGGQVPLKTLCEIKTPCIGDFIMMNEANLGVNKANVFITRQDMRDITVKTNGLSAVITRTIKNHSAGEPGSGTYKTYIRFFLPSSAVVTSLTIDGEVVPVKTVTKNGIPPLPYGEYDTSLPGLTGIAVALEIPVGKEKTIRLAYEIQNAVIYNTEKVQVELYEQKQSGIDTAPTVIKLRYPTSWKPITALDQLSATLANQGYLEYNTTMSQDVDIHLVFGIK